MEQIKSYIESLGLKVGIIDNRLKQFNQTTIKKIINNFFGDSTDIDIKYKCKEYVLEIEVIDFKTVDIYLIPKKEYISMYGNERYEED